MTDKNGEARTARAATSVLLGGLAVGAILGTASPAQACAGASASAETRSVSVRDQVRDAFTAGAIETSTQAAPAIICDPV